MGKMTPALLPLFPLHLVAFPRTRVPLHIFEERYKEMIGEAVANSTEFGIVLAQNEGILQVGCSMSVDKVINRYEDGRMDIIAVGVRRFEIEQLDQEKEYLRATVSFFDDDEQQETPPDVQFQALQQYKRWLELDEPRPFGDALLEDPQLSFQLAHSISDQPFRQSILQIRSEVERLKKVTSFLSESATKLRETARIRKAAPMNGHSSHLPNL